MRETIGEAFVAIRADTASFERDLSRKLSGAGRGVGEPIGKDIGDGISRGTPDGTGIGQKVGDGIKRGLASPLKQVSGLIAGAFAVRSAIGFLDSSLGEAQESQKAGAQTAAVLKSTGNEAHVTAAEIENLAGRLSEKAGVDDEVIQSGENMLLTFTNIRNEVGKGNNIFDQATAVALDMAAAMAAASGGEVDLRGASIQLGKALNDPVRGITALQRVGVTFTQQQKDQIKLAVFFGDTLGAQKIILGELTKEFGGSAAAQATGADKARVAWGNLKETIGTLLLPVLQKFLDFGMPIVRYLSQHRDLAAALAIVVGTVLVGAFAAWAASAVAAAATTLIALAPFLPIIAAIGLAIADGILLWQRYGDDVVEAIQPAIDIVNGLLDAAKGVLEWLGLINEEAAKATYNAPPNSGLYGTGPGGPNYNAPVSPYNPASGLYGTGPGGAPALDLSFLTDPNNPYNLFFAGKPLPYGPGLNGYASGGMVDGPLGAPQLAVVHGGERVFTPEQQSGMGETHQYFFTGPAPAHPTDFVMACARRRKVAAWAVG